MTRETAREFLPLVQALIEGKTIQLRCTEDHPWQDAENPDFSYPRSCYRIKPEPREVWGNEYPTGGVALFYSRQDADREAQQSRTAVIRFVEAERIPTK